MRIYLRLLVVSLLLFVGNIVYAEAQQEKRVTGTVTSEGETFPECLRTIERSIFRHHYRY